MNRSVTFGGFAALALVLAGCVTVSYEALDRVDQTLVGNRGYLMGEAPQVEEGQRPATRTVTRVDVELIPPKEAWQRWRGQQPAPSGQATPSTSAPATAAGSQ